MIIGKYELVREIGRGGMGSVWEARHASLGRRLAVKLIEDELATKPEARRRFDIEARAAASLDSRYTTHVFDHGVTADGRPFIVMELLVGESLAARASRGVLGLREVARIVQHVARGLSHAHERGIVHRDLKLENVFLARDGDGDEEVAKVLDFGVAKVLHSSEEPNAATHSGTLLGTPSYMSPEQARALAVDHRTDLWSLGVLVYRCVTGRFPFEGSSLGDLLVKICVEPIVAPSQLDPTLPEAFDAWMACALDRDPSRRWASAREMADALDAIACGIPTSRRTLAMAETLPSVPPLSTTAFTTKRTSGSRAIIAVAVLAFAMAGFAIGSIRARTGDGPAVVASPPTSEMSTSTSYVVAPTTQPIAVVDAGSKPSTPPSIKRPRRAIDRDIELVR